MPIAFTIASAIENIRRVANVTDEELSALTGIRRPQIGYLRSGEARSIKLEQLTALIAVAANHFPEEAIPALFIQSEPGLMPVLRSAKKGAIVVGRRSETEFGDLGFLVTYDSLCAAQITDSLSVHIGLRSHFIELPSVQGNDEERRAEFKRTQKTARDSFKTLRKDKAVRATFYIGSQRANLHTELFVAERWNATAFEPPQGRVPFYLRYRDDAPPRPPSCFGGSDEDFPGELPKDQRGEGIYYRLDGTWRPAPVPRPSKRGKHETAGVVVVTSNESHTHTELAFIGYTGAATQGCCNAVLTNPAAFWPVDRDTRRAAFLCTFEADKSNETNSTQGIDSTAPLHCTKVTRLDTVVRDSLRPPPSRVGKGRPRKARS